MTSDAVESIANRIGEVAPAWRDALAQPRTSTLRAPGALDALALGVEMIYEGYALHHATSRVLATDSSLALRLLVGDYCYAAGLCDIAETGDLDAVAALAELVADTATLAAELPTDSDARERRWDSAIAVLSSPAE